LCETDHVPLSENEQRILSEIEAQLAQSDPGLVREVAKTTVYSQALRNVKWATAAFLAGVAVMVMALSSHFLFAFVGFLIMLVAALAVERNARHLGKTGIAQISQRVRASGIAERMPEPGQRFRERRNPEDPE